LLSLGLEDLPWAASASPSGTQFRMLHGAFRDVSLLQVLTRSYPSKNKTTIAVQEGSQLIKKVLLSSYVFESNAELRDVAGDVIFSKDDMASGESIRLSIKGAINEIKSRTETDRVMMRAIELYYIDRIGSNEIVAEHLYLSISTYYRYVRKGIEKLALQFVNQ